MRFKGKTALVTGGRTGIGRAIAQRLAAEGARVMTAQRGDDEEFDSIRADFTDPESPQQVIDAVIARTGQLDILVNNVGMMQEARIEDMTFAD
jgi:meso-butanediol dehydrogenase/(S,S)-butanediol dehydrogenase/diacetyl reductase